MRRRYSGFDPMAKTFDVELLSVHYRFCFVVYFRRGKATVTLRKAQPDSHG